MKNVKTLLIFITISTFIYASGTRVASLGANAGFWADDYANIGAFPASVNNHNVAWTDGTNFTSVWNSDGTTWGFSGGDVNDVVNMMWGNGNLGVSVGLGMTPDVEATTATDEAETTYSVGFGMPLAGMDFGGTFDGDDLGINLRRAQDIPPFWDNVLVNFGMTLEDEDAGQSADMGLGAYAYNNRSYDNGSSSLFALGIDYDDEGCVGTGCTDPDAIINLVWTFAVESAMTEWATLRVGYNRAHDLGGGANTAGVVSMGLGLSYDSFSLDMNLFSPTLMLNDPVRYIHGRNDQPLGNGFTISYNW